MASESESNTPSTLTSDFASISIDTIEIESQHKLPEHDENSIRHDNKTYTRGKARPVKKRTRSPESLAWYWSHGEEISEGKQRRWKCEPCWQDNIFTHYS